MAKTLLLINSIVINLALVAFIWLDSKQCGYQQKDFERVDKARLEDIAVLEKLFKGSLSKEQIKSTLKSKFKEDEWFDKPEDLGVGVGRLFLIFEKGNQLQKIEADSFQGK